ncbi:MAG: hypothetical protein WCV99_07580 [Sterolibacterium sp.]
MLTLLFLTQFPKIRTDTNPKHMLPETSDVRVWNDKVDQTFALYEDTIVVGIENAAGVLNLETLGRIARITDAVLALDGVASRDVNGFTTITNVTAAAGTLNVGPLMRSAPTTEAEVEALRKALFGNSLFIDRVISKDGRTTAIYVPLEKGANGAEIADKIRQIVAREKGPERYYVAGDPVARDTCGARYLWRRDVQADGDVFAYRGHDHVCGDPAHVPQPRALGGDDGCVDGSHYLEHRPPDRRRLSGAHHEFDGAGIPDGHRHRQHPHFQRVLLPLPRRR